jgi:DnaJ like chaperone protein
LLMDIFDRLANLFRSFIDDDSETTTEQQGNRKYYDPDMQDAWDELNDYMDKDKEPGKEQSRGSRPSGQKQSYESYSREKERETIRKDYANLEVAFGAPFEEVKKAYKKLLIIYHPDRNADNAEKLKMSTEITKKINESFKRIKDFEGKHHA